MFLCVCRCVCVCILVSLLERGCVAPGLTPATQLWDVMSGQEACDLVRDIADPDEAASALLTTAIGKGTTDNITVIVVRL